jgi:hypothetical protein
MAANQSPTDPDALLSLVQRIKEHYQKPPRPLPKRGKKRDFSALFFLLLAAVAVTLRTFGNSELRSLLEKDQRLRQTMGFERVPQGDSASGDDSQALCPKPSSRRISEITMP